jgi:hypothetical protein
MIGWAIHLRSNVNINPTLHFSSLKGKGLSTFCTRGVFPLFADITSCICRMPWWCMKQQTLHTLPELEDILHNVLFLSFVCCQLLLSCRFQNRRLLLVQTHQTYMCLYVCARGCMCMRVYMHVDGGTISGQRISTYYLYINDIQFFFNYVMNNIQGVYFTYSTVSTTSVFHCSYFI